MTTTVTDYETEIETWRRQVEQTLRADDGWLTVAGLFWLEEGANSVGCSPNSVVLLPEGAPAHVGTLQRSGREVAFIAALDSNVHVNGQPVAGPTPLNYAMSSPDLLTLDDLTLFVIERGERLGVRLRDKKSEARRTFAGRVWFPVDERYRLEGTFIAYEPPKPMTTVNILGDSSETTSPGAVHFAINGERYALDVSSQSSSGLFIVFRDATAGHETYPAARFLYLPLPRDGVVTVDFNRAVSPPCAFTAFATCPLPAPQNRLPIRIAAGERYEASEH